MRKERNMCAKERPPGTIAGGFYCKPRKKSSEKKKKKSGLGLEVWDHRDGGGEIWGGRFRTRIFGLPLFSQ